MVEPSEQLQLVFDKAVDVAKKLQHEYVTLEHLLFAMLCESSFAKIIEGYGSDPEFLKKNVENYLKTQTEKIQMDPAVAKKYKPKKTHAVERVLNRAFTQVLFSGRQHLQTIDLFHSIMVEDRSYSRYLFLKYGVTKEELTSFFNKNYTGEDEEELHIQMANETLGEYCTNLNKQKE